VASAPRRPQAAHTEVRVFAPFVNQETIFHRLRIPSRIPSVVEYLLPTHHPHISLMSDLLRRGLLSGVPLELTSVLAS
jgi:hypothetical protein